MDNGPIIIERTYNAAVSKVWKAITDKDEMKKWYFDLKEFKPQIGFEFRFTGGKPDGRQYLHICEITEVVPEKRLKHSWRYDGFDGISYVTWNLFDEGEKTRIKLTHEGIETFKPDNPDLAKENFVEGWRSIIEDSLKNFVENNKAT